MTIGFVGTVQYGIWITLASFTAWISFFDIGLGNGLRNKFIEAVALGDKERAKIYVSTTYAVIGIIIGIFWVIFASLVNYIDWSKILNAPPALAEELRNVVFIVITCFCFQFVLSLVNTLLNALQKPALSACFDTLSQAIIVLIIYTLIHAAQGSLLLLSMVSGFTYVLILIISSFYFFSHDLKEYAPRLKDVKFRYIKGLTGLGFKFFFLQILSLLFYSTNNIVIAQMSGPEDVAVYNVAYKYMGILQMGFMIIIAPFWSAFADANTKQDYLWMKQTAKRLRLLVLLISIAGLILLVISPVVYQLWIKGKVAIPFLLTALLYIYHIINIWCSMHSNLIYGIGKIKVQMISSSIVCLLNLPLTIMGCYYWGIEGLVVSQIFLVLVNVWVGPYQLKKLLNKSAYGIWNQ